MGTNPAGERLREAMAAARMRPTDLAHELGVSSQRVSQIITRGAKSVEVWQRIADALNKPLAYFLADDAPPDDVQTSSDAVAAELREDLARATGADLNATPPPDAIPPGVRALLDNAAACEALALTPQERRYLAAPWPVPGGVQTQQEAIHVLNALRAIQAGRR